MVFRLADACKRELDFDACATVVLRVIPTSVSSDPTPQKTPQTTTDGHYQTDRNGQDSLQTKDYNDQTDTSKQMANYS